MRVEVESEVELDGNLVVGPEVGLDVDLDVGPEVGAEVIGLIVGPEVGVEVTLAVGIDVGNGNTEAHFYIGVFQCARRPQQAGVIFGIAQQDFL